MMQELRKEMKEVRWRVAKFRAGRGGNAAGLDNCRTMTAGR